MHLVPPDQTATLEPTPSYSAGRAAADELIASLHRLYAALATFMRTTNPEWSDETEELFLAREEIAAAVKNILEPVYREPQQALVHGLAFGLWYAGKPELIRNFPENTRKHLWTFPFPGREELLKAAAKAR